MIPPKVTTMIRSPIVFLDIDGVLVRWDDRHLDQDCVRRLDRLVQERSARVVVTSSWRESMKLGAIEADLQRAGACFTLHDATPVFVGASRGDEIVTWRESHDMVAPFVIIDDCSDIGPFHDRLVQTESYVGLADDDVARAAMLLKHADRMEETC